MILGQSKEIIDEYLKKKEELEKQGRQNEIIALRADVQFRLDALLNGLNYSIFKQ